jgi:8-oxo-dGTP diphosphatase
MSQDLIRALGHKVRVRACGLVIHDDALLLVRLQAPTRAEPFWSVPGGGVQHGESLEAAVTRELHEETGLEVAVDRLFYISEFIQDPFHAVEFYFLCQKTGGILTKGHDPEYETASQMILDVAFTSLNELAETELFPEFIRHRFYSDQLSQSNTPIWIRSDGS